MDREVEVLLDKTLPKAKRFAELEELLTYPEVVADKMYFLNLEKEKRSLEKCVEIRKKLVDAVESLDFYNEYAQTEGENLENQLQNIGEQIQDYRRQLEMILVDIVDDDEDARIELFYDKQIEEQINKIVDKYCLIAEKLKLTCQCVRDKYIVLLVKGRGAYSLFKSECGVYRIKINGIKVYFTVVVSAELEREPSIDMKDIKFELFHSSGAGGQNVNKVETAVRARYIPTGLAVACQDERSQLQNKERALKLLLEKIEAQQLEESKKKKDLLLKSLNSDKNKGIFKRDYDFDKNIVKTSDGATLILSENLEKVILGNY